MAQVVQAKCPHCKNVLRIPAEWADKPMRCKHCQKTFQGKAKPKPTPASVQTAEPVAALTNGHVAAAPVAVARRPSGNDFSFDAYDDEPIRPKVGARKKKGSGMFVAFLLLFLLGAAGAGGFFAYRHFNPENNLEDPENNLVAQNGNSNNENSPPKKGNGNNTQKKKTPSGLSKGAFPRRALLISISNYLFLNTVDYGSNSEQGYPGSSTGVLRDQLQRPPMNFPATQITEMSDAAKSSHPVQKATIETSIQDFLESSRAQDRVVLFFSGHGTEIEKEAYLIPIEGRKSDPESLVSLKWVYEQLAKCKARQKIFILDVNRFPPGRGFELPGAGGDEGEMGEVFDEALKNPPPGVQVWSACVKGQRSIEFEKGSIFMQSLCKVLKEGGGMTGISAPTDPIPVAALVPKVNQRLKQLLEGMKDMAQESRLTGHEAETGAPYDPDESAPAQLTLKPPPPPKEGAASLATVNSILNELKLVPRVRESRTGEDRLLDAGNLPPFPAKALADFKGENEPRMADLRGQYEKDPDAFGKIFPVRRAVFDAIKALEDSHRLELRETQFGPINDQIKEGVLNEQKKPGRVISKMGEALDALATLGDEREKEKSKRWLAHLDFTTARLQARLIYLYEYSFVLGQIRSDSLPSLEPGQNGWRIAASKKISVTEASVKKMAKETAKAWKTIQDEYQDTPWAIMAHRESLVGLGLEWRSKAD